MTALILGGIGLLLGIGVIAAKVDKVTKALKEISDVLIKTSDAFADKKLSKAEIDEIIKEGKEALIAIKDIF